MKKIIEWIIILIGCLASGCIEPEENFVPINDYYVKLELGGFLELQSNGDIHMEELEYLQLYNTPYYIAVQKCLDDDNYSYYYRPVGSMQKLPNDTVIFIFCPTDGQIKESISIATK